MSVIKSKYPLTAGIHPADNKVQSASAALQYCPMPKQLLLPLNMHAGAAAKAIVNIGDSVYKGQCIAEAENGISAFIHSPVVGQISDIRSMPVANRSGLEETVIVIDCQQQQPNSYHEMLEWSKQSAEQLLETIKLAGVVGLGGAGFPSHHKIISGRKSIHTLLLNGAECEPYISCDDRTMRDYSAQILEGALILSRVLGCSKIQIAIEDNKPQAIAAISRAVELFDKHSTQFEVLQIPTCYPSGGERQLIEIVTGKQVPSGGFPSALGYNVQNIGTALAVYDALVLDKPLIDRIVTVTGDSVSRPGNYRVAFGTPIRHLLEFAGWDEAKTHLLIHGGPMMGFPLPDADRPISKISNCIIAGSIEEFPEPEPERACIRCGQCADVCPASLLPQQLLWFSKSGEIDKAKDIRLLDCIECGACAYVCPSQIPLVDYYRFSKAELRNKAAAKIKSEQSKQRFDFRNQRLEQQEMEIQRKRKAKARLIAEKNLKGDGIDAKKQLVADALARVQAKKDAKDKTDV